MEIKGLGKPLSSLPDEELIHLTTSDKHAFEILYYRYKDKIYNYIWTLVNFNKEDAIGLAADTFIKTYEYAQTKTIKHVHAFLYRTAHNIAVNYIKKQQANKEITSEEMIEQQSIHTSGITEQSNKKHKQQLVQQLLSRLDAQYKEAIYLHYFEQKSYQDIADAMHTNKNTIGTYISRGKQQLKTLAKSYGIQAGFDL